MKTNADLNGKFEAITPDDKVDDIRDVTVRNEKISKEYLEFQIRFIDDRIREHQDAIDHYQQLRLKVEPEAKKVKLKPKP